jgi:hypothetical protein
MAILKEEFGIARNLPTNAKLNLKQNPLLAIKSSIKSVNDKIVKFTNVFVKK